MVECDGQFAGTFSGAEKTIVTDALTRDYDVAASHMKSTLIRTTWLQSPMESGE